MKQRKSRRIARLGAMLTMVMAVEAGAAELAWLSVRGGPTIPANDPDADAVALSVGIRPESVPELLRYPGDEVYYEFVVGQLMNAGPPEDEVEYARALVDWRYHPGMLPDAMFVEVGPGITIRSSDHVERDQGGEFFFTTQVTLGAHLGPERRNRVALRLEHTSNAGLEEENPGINIISLEYGYRWGM